MSDYLEYRHRPAAEQARKKTHFLSKLFIAFLGLATAELSSSLVPRSPVPIGGPIAILLMTMSARLSLRQKFTSKQSSMRTRLRDYALTTVHGHLGSGLNRSEEGVTKGTIKVVAIDTPLVKMAEDSSDFDSDASGPDRREVQYGALGRKFIQVTDANEAGDLERSLEKYSTLTPDRQVTRRTKEVCNLEECSQALGTVSSSLWLCSKGIPSGTLRRQPWFHC